MSEGAVAPAPRLEPPHWSLWLLYLVFRPREFFSTFVLEPTPVLTVLCAWTFGVVSFMDRVELKAMASPNAAYAFIYESWARYWGISAVAGALSGALYYALGGFWYRLRLKWSGAGSPDPKLARRVYVYSAQAYVVPYLLYTAWTTTAYADPSLALAGDDWVSLAILLGAVWSVYVSYRGVRTVFDVKRWPARIWFFVLPLFVYIAVFSGVVLAMFFANPSFMESPPNLEQPTRLERAGFVLDYPGNWEIDTADSDYDPDANFSIGPVYADALIRVFFYEGPLDSQECVDETRANLEEYNLEGVVSRNRWGRFPGAGYFASAQIDGRRYDVFLFCAAEGPIPFEIMQVVEESATELTRPGFELIRDSLELRLPEGE